MDFKKIEKYQWDGIKNVYIEAFPKVERKPFFLLKKAVKKEKSEIWVASENKIIAGFIVLIPYKDIIMVEYLAVSNQVRSKGTGSKILKEICKNYNHKRIILLIEKIDETASNNEQRIARKRFYLKNSFKESGIFIKGMSGYMEILYYGDNISGDEFIDLQSYALGKILFWLSKTKIVQENGE